MPVYQLDERLIFPRPELAEDGLLAVGGDLRPERLLLAYAHGIFPWYGPGMPILWHSPDPRMALHPRDLHVPRSLERTLRRGRFQFSLDREFAAVVEGCATSRRGGGEGTWITPEMAAAYGELHELGFAHSAEAWEGEELAGGLYGVSLGGAFFGESMFARRPDASKAAFVTLVRWLDLSGVELVDCQVETAHLARFGARPWPRRRFLAELARALERPTRRGRWELGPDPAGAG